MGVRPEDKIVDIVARGIQDENVRTILSAARCKIIPELNALMSVFPKPKTSAKVKDDKTVRDTRSASSRTKNNRKRGANVQNRCFTCGKIDNFKRDCPEYKKRKSLRAQSVGGWPPEEEFPKKAKVESNRKRCGYCGLNNHVEDNCFKKEGPRV